MRGSNSELHIYMVIKPLMDGFVLQSQKVIYKVSGKWDRVVKTTLA